MYLPTTPPRRAQRAAIAVTCSAIRAHVGNVGAPDSHRPGPRIQETAHPRDESVRPISAHSANRGEEDRPDTAGPVAEGKVQDQRSKAEYLQLNSLAKEASDAIASKTTTAIIPSNAMRAGAACVPASPCRLNSLCGLNKVVKLSFTQFL